MKALPPLRAVGGADEIHLPAGARVGDVAQALRAALADQVDLQRGVDRAQLVVARGDPGIVGELHRMHLDRRVAMQRAVQAVRAEREGGDVLPGMKVLRRLVTAPDSISDRMPSPIISVWMPRSRLCCNCITTASGDAAVADLQRGAVVDEVGDVLADGFLHRADLRQADFEQRLVAFHQAGDLRDVDVAVAVGERHVRVHLEQHHASRAGSPPWCSRARARG